MPKPRTAEHYGDDITAASLSGLAELMTALGAYRDALVLIGGWAPFFILERFGEPGAFQADAFQADAFQTAFEHVGSIDIDLVVDPDAVDAQRYATIVDALVSRGWQPIADSRFQFERVITSPRTGQPHPIQVDFLTPRPLPGRGRSRRHRTVQRDLQARTLAGAEVALSHWFWHELDARLPGGADAHVRFKVVDVVGSLALKGFAIGDRYAEKDAYDIFTLAGYYQGGPASVARALRPFRDEPPVRRGLEAIAEKFRAQEAEGPSWVADFLSPRTAEDRERIRLDAFMRVGEVLRILATG